MFNIKLQKKINMVKEYGFPIQNQHPQIKSNLA